MRNVDYISINGRYLVGIICLLASFQAFSADDSTPVLDPSVERAPKNRCISEAHAIAYLGNFNEFFDPLHSSWRTEVLGSSQYRDGDRPYFENRLEPTLKNSVTEGLAAFSTLANIPSGPDGIQDRAVLENFGRALSMFYRDHANEHLRPRPLSQSVLNDLVTVFQKLQILNQDKDRIVIDLFDSEPRIDVYREEDRKLLKQASNLELLLELIRRHRVKPGKQLFLNLGESSPSINITGQHAVRNEVAFRKHWHPLVVNFLKDSRVPQFYREFLAVYLHNLMGVVPPHFEFYQVTTLLDSVFCNGHHIGLSPLVGSN